MSGDSNCAGLRSGFKFSLQDHYRSDLDSDYLVTHLTHFGSQGAGYATPMGGGEGPAYRNEFTCIPAEVPYRPPRLTPEPRIPGIMTAKVETAGGDYAHIDEDGRYRVKMPFDLSERTNANASRAIRVAQPYTGSGYGMHFPVHAGTEMVWACIDGNVDRPLGLSTVPNASQATPVTSANKSINMIKTASNNVISMDDTIGLQKLAISTPYDNSISAGHDQAITVENDRTITVNGTHTETIKKDTAITISEGKYKHDVAAGTADYHVQGALTEKYDTNQKTTVANEIEITSSGSKVHITAATEIQLKVGASTLLMKSDGSIELNGVNLAVNGSASINIHGASVTSKADADHNIEGAIVVSKGSGTNTVSGGMVMLNP
jgi:type VI secretion system secreted protein VgrG